MAQAAGTREARTNGALTRPTRLPLETGDLLTRREFERRYEAWPEIKKAELVEGVVFVASPVKATAHGEQHGHVMAWLGAYCASHAGVMLADNTTVRLDLDNELQPDALLRKREGGTSRIDEDGYVSGAPELVVEVASTSASYDLHQKLAVYRRNGVQEYIVWRVLDGALDWFELREGNYIHLRPNRRGVIQSRVFPGLRLAVSKLLSGDLAGVLAEQRP